MLVCYCFVVLPFMCVYVCIYIYIYIYICVCVCVCPSVWTCLPCDVGVVVLVVL